MHEFSNIFYILGVIWVFLGFILYNYGMSNGGDLLPAAVSIGVGVAFLLATYIRR